MRFLTFIRRLLQGTLLVLLALVYSGLPLSGQGTISQQVLQLLTRTNSWTGQNTFYNIRIPIAAVPGDTSARLYTDVSGNLYYNAILIAGTGGVTNPHNLLSTTHPDTLPASVARGALVVGNSTPAWSKYQPSVSGCHVQWDGTDTLCATSGASLTSLPAANLTGTIAAISGVNVTNLNASALASGTVPLARISGLTNTQIDASAGIVYSKLTLTGGIVNADINASAAVAYSKLALTGAVVNADISASAAIALAKLAQTGASSGQVIAWNGSAWAPASAGGATVTSVGLALPAIFSVSGSPVTTSGTLTGALATQTANTIWAGPTTGAAAAPTFRAAVAADVPNLPGTKITTGVLNMPAGTSAAPPYSFAAETTLGLYRFGAGIIGMVGSLYPAADGTQNLGLTTQRLNNGYFAGNTLANTLRLGWNATANNNTLLGVDAASYPAMLFVSNGSGSARGDIALNRLAMGSAFDPTFVNNSAYTRFNMYDSWTSALTAQEFIGFRIGQTVNQTGAATQAGLAASIDLGTTSASNQTALEGLRVSAYYQGSAALSFLTGMEGRSFVESGNVTSSNGVAGIAYATGGTVTDQYGGYFYTDGDPAATITTNYVVYIDKAYSTPTVTNWYGLYITDQTVATATTNYAIFYGAPASRTFGVLADGDVIEGSWQATDLNVAAPAGADCDNAAEIGKFYWDSTNDNAYLCSGASGWRKVTTTTP